MDLSSRQPIWLRSVEGNEKSICVIFRQTTENVYDFQLFIDFNCVKLCAGEIMFLKHSAPVTTMKLKVKFEFQSHEVLMH